jgi:hypothetical protein
MMGSQIPLLLDAYSSIGRACQEAGERLLEIRIAQKRRSM